MPAIATFAARVPWPRVNACTWVGRDADDGVYWDSALRFSSPPTGHSCSNPDWEFHCAAHPRHSSSPQIQLQHRHCQGLTSASEIPKATTSYGFKVSFINARPYCRSQTSNLRSGPLLLFVWSFSGYLDNLLVTPLGDLIAVECKLWRNVEARREVVAQIIDYAKDLQTLTYDALESAIRNARSEPSFNLHASATASCDDTTDTLDEPRFVDAVSRNLRRGRCLLVILGDVSPKTSRPWRNSSSSIPACTSHLFSCTACRS